jgi:hypothetical protein
MVKAQESVVWNSQGTGVVVLRKRKDMGKGKETHLLLSLRHGVLA